MKELAHFSHFVEHILRYITVLKGHALIRFIPDNGLVFHQVDNALELVFSADCHLQRYRVGSQAIFQLLYNLVEIGTRAIHLVDKHQAGDFVFIRLTPDRLRLWLDAGRSAQYNHSTIQHAQRTLHFNGEIHVSGSVDDIDPMVIELGIHAFPETGRRRRGDSDAALLLLFHPVHGRGAIVHFTNLVRSASVKKYALGCCGFTRIHMRADANIAIPADRSFTCHDWIPNKKCRVKS
jgi:hypothetical protein